MHKLIDAAHPPKPVQPGELPPDVTFGRNLIGFAEKLQERQQVAEVQAALLKLGYDVGKVDGKYGPKTAKAIKGFQKEHQLKVDGKVSESLLERLKAAGASTGQQIQ
ncbi:MAG: peptidoglycan-binding protein [Deltaproteobacteria bacterium]|nr:peptidoglycan-binding protein [Deltaproteobacteria bacterium]